MIKDLTKWTASIFFLSFTALGNDIHCSDSQKFILNFSAKSLEKVVTSPVLFDDLDLFIQSKPSIEASVIHIMEYVSRAGDYEEIWCKLKSQEALAIELKVEVLGPPFSCGSLLEKVLTQSLRDILEDPPRLPSLESLGIIIDEDQEFSSGLSWKPSKVSFRYTDTYAHLRASRLRTPTWIPQIGGMNYCKVLSASGANKFLRDVLAVPH